MPQLATVSAIQHAPQRYRTILADPPWPVLQTGIRGAEQHYNLMSLERIAALPVSDLAAEDAHLWLWVTNATLRHGYDIAEEWGFTVRAPLTWVKFRLGLGIYLRNSTEHLLFATRGKAPVRYRSQPTLVMEAPFRPRVFSIRARRNQPRGRIRAREDTRSRGWFRPEADRTTSLNSCRDGLADGGLIRGRVRVVGGACPYL